MRVKKFFLAPLDCRCCLCFCTMVYLYDPPVQHCSKKLKDHSFLCYIPSRYQNTNKHTKNKHVLHFVISAALPFPFPSPVFFTDLFANVRSGAVPVHKPKARATVYGKWRRRQRAQSAFTSHGWREGLGRRWKAGRRGCGSEVISPRQHWPCR